MKILLVMPHSGAPPRLYHTEEECRHLYNDCRGGRKDHIVSHEFTDEQIAAITAIGMQLCRNCSRPIPHKPEARYA